MTDFDWDEDEFLDDVAGSLEELARETYTSTLRQSGYEWGLVLFIAFITIVVLASFFTIPG